MKLVVTAKKIRLNRKQIVIISGFAYTIYLMRESNGLSKDKDYWMYGLSNLDLDCTKKETRSYFKNKYC